MQIEPCRGVYDNEIISLILGMQNDEAGIGLSIQEQSDLLDIAHYYQQAGGNFWIALSDGKVIGTIGLMLKDQHCAVLKKFFVKKSSGRRESGLRYTRRSWNTRLQQVPIAFSWIRHPSHTNPIGFTRRRAFA